MPNYERKIPTTGFWIFVCNLDFWNADQWFSFGERDLLYRISTHHQYDMKAGQQGVLRVSEDRRSLEARKGRPKMSGGIYALFEVTGPAKFMVDPDTRCNSEKFDARPRWRVPLRIVKDGCESPLLLKDLPDEPGYKYLRRPLQTSSIAISQPVFDFIATKLGYQADEMVDRSLVWSVDDEVLVNSLQGLLRLEEKFANATPELKSRVSRHIERGKIGQAVKQLRNGKCQLCEALGQEPVAFLKKSGENFSEAHHVIPVRSLERGALSSANIMVLCPNHHRQAHFGKFELEKSDAVNWIVRLDGVLITLEKPILPLTN